MTASFTASQTKERTATPAKSYKAEWVFVLQLNNGRYVVGTATNPSRRIAALNSGMNKAIPEPLSVYRIVGVKPQDEERTLISVTKKLYDRLGEDRVLAV